MHAFPVKAPRVFQVLFPSLVLALLAGPASAQWTFTDQTIAAGLTGGHDVDTLSTVEREQTGGAAAGDYNGDGWMDLYVVGGNNAHNYLYRNNGDGTFSDVAAAAGVALTGVLSNGPTFADWDGDGDLDLFVGGMEGASSSLFSNNGDGTFTDVTVASGVAINVDTYSASFADYDNDGDLDFFAAHWGVTPQGTGHVWRNNGDGTFTDADALVGYTGFPPSGGDNTFTYNLADINSDGWMDMLVASDFLTSHVYTNDGDGTFTNVTNALVITDENGMGSAVGDYDDDGDLDWFVTSIYNFPTKSGNRLYKNDGAGNFSDATAAAGVANGSWGWGATFQDLNNDGSLDIYMVNGWRNGYANSKNRLFQSNNNGTFTNQAPALNCNDGGEGRGVVCFDYDNDGDLDIYVANNDQPAVFYRNDGLTTNWLQVELVGPAPNTQAIGARVKMTAGMKTQMRELRAGNNFLSQDPVMAHFGLNALTTATTVVVEWLDGQITTLNNVAANQRLTITHPAVDAPVIGPGVASTELTLLGASPNPFRSGATIRFSLAQSTENASIRVFDTAGRLVRNAFEAPLTAGEQAVTWDGRDDRGQVVGSGIYYYEVRAGEQSVRGKLTRLR